MTVKIRARDVVVGLLACWLVGLGGARTAAAHPEFSALGTNRYVTAAIYDGRLDVDDALLEGALVSGDERRRLDADGDGRISERELRAGEARLAAEGAAVTVEIDGRAVTAPVAVSVDLGDDASADAAPVAVERRLSFPAAVAGPRRLRLVVTREPPKLLDTELGLVLGPGYTLASGEDRVTFRGPRASALEERAASFEITAPPQARSARGPVVIAGALVVATVLGVAWALRRRARRSAAR